MMSAIHSMPPPVNTDALLLELQQSSIHECDASQALSRRILVKGVQAWKKLRIEVKRNREELFGIRDSRQNLLKRLALSALKQDENAWQRLKRATFRHLKSDHEERERTRSRLDRILQDSDEVRSKMLKEEQSDVAKPSLPDQASSAADVPGALAAAHAESSIRNLSQSGWDNRVRLAWTAQTNAIRQQVHLFDKQRGIQRLFTAVKLVITIAVTIIVAVVLPPAAGVAGMLISTGLNMIQESGQQIATLQMQKKSHQAAERENVSKATLERILSDAKRSERSESLRERSEQRQVDELEEALHLARRS